MNVRVTLALQSPVSLTWNDYNSLYIVLANTSDYSMLKSLTDTLVVIRLIYAVFLSVAYTALNKLFVIFIYYWYTI